MVNVEFHFDFGSPNAYLAHLVIPEVEQRTGAKFDYVPVLLGGVFRLTGNRSPGESVAGIKNKLEYEHLEITRFIERHGISGFRRNPFFPVNTLTHHAGRRGGAGPRRLRALRRRNLPAHVVGAKEARRSGAFRISRSASASPDQSSPTA
jgi:DSBA-like thioredoxin domain